MVSLSAGAGERGGDTRQTQQHPLRGLQVNNTIKENFISNTSPLLFRTNENHYGIKTPYKRCPFPDKWRGLHERELEKVSDVPGAIFVHNGGYVAYAVDRSAALNMIDAAIAEDDRRKEAMSEILKKQEINDVVKSLRRMSVRAYK